MARMSPGAVLVLVILLLVLFNPSGSPPSKAEQQHARAIVASERQKLQILHNSTFGDFQPHEDKGKWLSLPGFEQNHGLKWHLFEGVQEKARDQARYVAGQEWKDVYYGNSNTSLLLYHNVSGVAHGKWVRSSIGEDLNSTSVNLTALLPPGVEYLSNTWRRNVTGPEGRLTLYIEDESVFDELGQPEQWTRDMSATVVIQDETSHAEGWVSTLYGIHHVASGSVLLSSTSEKFAGLFALPHLALSEFAFNTSKSQIERFVNETINRQEDKHDDNDNPWRSTRVHPEEDPVSPMCELVVYAQQHLIHPDDLGMGHHQLDESQSVLEMTEDELRFPQGRNLPSPPPLSMSAVIFSPDCGFVLESKGPPGYFPQIDQHLHGLRVEAQIKDARHVLLLFSLVLMAQLYVLVSEIKHVSTPAKRSRISFYTMAMLSLGSGITTVLFLSLSAISVSFFVLAVVVAFVGSLDGLIFSMRLMVEIWSAQEPERLENERRRQRAAAAARPNSGHQQQQQTSPPPAIANELPLPVTQPRPTDTGATAVLIPSDQDMTQPAATATTQGTTFGTVYLRYSLVFLAITFSSLWAASSVPPVAFRIAYTNILLFVYLSFWVPQIYRNIVRNGRKALTPRFILGQTILRPLPIAYFYAVTDNVLLVDTDVRMLLVYAAWLWIQIVVLASQEVLGPRYLVSEKWSWVPTAWDYHPVLREDEEGAMMPIGYSAAASTSAQAPSATADEAGPSTLGSGSARKAGSGGKGMRLFDCAICMQEIEAPVVPASALDSSTAAKLSPSSPIAAMMAAGSAGAGVGAPGFIARRAYMVTPCRHIFHSACLEHWIGYRLQCPICRDTLPPL